MRRFICFLLLFSLLLLGGCGTQTDTPAQNNPPAPPPDAGLPDLTTVVFSIGKADAILIHDAEYAILIDTGETEDSAEILAYLRKKKIDNIDAMILTHYDKDHVGGAAGIVEGIEIGSVYGTYESKQSEEYDLYQDALNQKSLVPTVVEKKTNLFFGNIHMTIYPPEMGAYDTKESNNSSLVIHMTYGKTSFLFGGDAQEDRIEELLTLGTALDCDFMKVPYHGNAINNLSALLAITTPDYAVITCSDKNPEDPSKITVLRDAGARVFLTRAGNVYATSDGVEVTVRH
ncbi:MAG: MBL fold metallo-hydrolase [Clostridia bacterium]|nr:MBL fold metallo-hydrolase [Clostridia bacterium]